MKSYSRALLAGWTGAVTTNVLHEIVRRTLPAAPRVDLLGMQALAKTVRALGLAPPTGRRLYAATLASDLVSNAAYFALVAAGPSHAPVANGIVVGLAAGAGAVGLPAPLGLTPSTTARTPLTRVLTCALYAAGGLSAGFALRALPLDDPAMARASRVAPDARDGAALTEHIVTR